MKPNPPLHFYPGVPHGAAAALTPLARFLPPLPPGMVTAWLNENISPGEWVLDPLGASPALALEAARAGYRVLVASNNPILTFMTETLAQAPNSADFQSALAELAMSKRGEERLERHIRDLYLTNCDTCGDPVEAQAFLWRKGENQPFARLYTCPRCGESGELPVLPQDLERLEAMGGDRYQRSRAVQRVVLNNDQYRADVEEALEHYLPRSLYVLFTLLNKIDSLNLPAARVRLLQALLISSFDAGNTLWPWPSGRSRPKQLLVPPQYRENNLWFAIENAASEWSGQPGPVPVTNWPQQPPESGGICIFRGRMRNLTDLSQSITPQAVSSVFPRPNQAFWTLSAVWTGWLWGASAALPLRNVLDRRRYDWNWHTFAIHQALSTLPTQLSPQTPFFGVLPELVPGFLGAAVIAANASGFVLNDIALRNDIANGRMEQDLAQLRWYPSGSKAAPAAPPFETLDQYPLQGIQEDLARRAEPAPYNIEYAAGLLALAQANAIPYISKQIPGDLFTRIQAALTRAFTHRTLRKLPGASTEEERSLWTLSRPDFNQGDAPSPDEPETTFSLSDRIEMELVRFLQKQPICTMEELDQALCLQFPGLLTPHPEILRICLESYAENIAGQPRKWQMRSGDIAAARIADLQEMFTLLEVIGQKLSFSSQRKNNTLTWLKDGQETWRFCGLASSVISRYVYTLPVSIPGRNVLVLPGGRAQLLQYKLKHNPILEAASASWRFLKFRQLRAIAWRDTLSAESFEALLKEDTLTYEPNKMELFL